MEADIMTRTLSEILEGYQVARILFTVCENCETVSTISKTDRPICTKCNKELQKKNVFTPAQYERLMKRLEEEFPIGTQVIPTEKLLKISKNLSNLQGEVFKHEWEDICFPLHTGWKKDGLVIEVYNVNLFEVVKISSTDKWRHGKKFEI